MQFPWSKLVDDNMVMFEPDGSFGYSVLEPLLEGSTVSLGLSSDPNLLNDRLSLIFKFGDEYCASVESLDKSLVSTMEISGNGIMWN